MDKLVRLSDILSEQYGQPKLRYQHWEAAPPFDWSAGIPSTGFGSLDEHLGGIPGEGLVLVGARPGVGKTSFLIDLAMSAAKQRVLVSLFSLEWDAKRFAQRFISAEARVSLESTCNHTHGKDSEEASNAAKMLSSLEIYIDDTPAQSLGDIEFLVNEKLASVREFGADYQKALVVVDYLELVQVDVEEGAYASRNAAVSTGLKTLSEILGCPVFSACQLSHGAELRPEKKPNLRDVRCVGAEGDVDAVLLIHRSRDAEEWQDPLMPDRGQAEIIVAKNRWGRTGSVRVSFDDECSRFFE